MKVFGHANYFDLNLFSNRLNQPSPTFTSPREVGETKRSPCPDMLKQGFCSRTDQCRYSHDVVPNKVSIGGKM